MEAIEEVEQIDPDVILLYLGLPKLNGIELAQRVCKFCPAAKILIISQDLPFAVVARRSS